MDPRKLQRVIVDALEDVKAQAIEVFNTTGQTGLFDRVILATGTSNRQTRALASHVRDKIKAAGGHVISVEGEETGEWVLVDAGDAVVHIMQPAIRAYYNLEEIWGSKPVRMKRRAADMRARGDENELAQSVDADEMPERHMNDGAPDFDFAIDDANGDADFDGDTRSDRKPGTSARAPRARAAKAQAATKPRAKTPSARKAAAARPAATTAPAKRPSASKRAAATSSSPARKSAAGAKTGAARTGFAGSTRSAPAAKSAAARTPAKARRTRTS